MRRLYSSNTSGVPGVVWDKHAQKWRARLYHGGKVKSLGYFQTVSEAAQTVLRYREALQARLDRIAEQGIR